MCKNADAPCPGCKKHAQTDGKWMFFTDQERRQIEGDQIPIALHHQKTGHTDPAIIVANG